MPIVNPDSWLPLVSKPSRYIDNEFNAAHKAWQPLNFCFAYPDVYEVGISHLGIKILYSIVNGIDGAMADRCYLPWLDMIEVLRREDMPLFGLESRRALCDFDLLGITLQSELTYTNILEMLDLAQIPVYSAERGESDPIVLAGGPCATNPLPLSPFIDAFFIGESEEGIKQIVSIFQAHPGRKERLAELARLESCYVPLHHDSLLQSGWKVKSRKFTGFSQSTDLHSPQLLSWQLATHNRCVSEIMRGCSRGCRFCHAGYFYRPVRERSAEDIRNELLSEIEHSGWDEAGLLSLSSNDYSRINDLLFDLLERVDTDKTHVSLPSLRVDSLDSETVELLRRLGREGLTIAPEAGSQRLRDVINKNLTEEQILNGVRTALTLGWQKVKLYFMLGLPTETEDDVQGIIDLIRAISSVGGKRVQINVTLSPFVPKTFTPFQWAAMLPREELLHRCLMVKQAFFKQNHIKIKYHTIETSVLEALFSRGDTRLGESIHQAWKLGARFDGWNECFDYSIWQRAFDDCGLDTEVYLAARDPQIAQPWEFIDTGVTRDFWLAEWENALNARTTEDCRQSCSNCGVCTEDIHTEDAPPMQRLTAQTEVASKTVPIRNRNTQYRYRVFYAKTGILRFISHLDWMRMLFRLISKSTLEVVFTQGFSPHPKVGLCPPLPLGVEGECEFFDISFYRSYSFEEIQSALCQTLIPQFTLLHLELLTAKAPLPQAEWVRIVLPDAYLERSHLALDDFARKTEFLFTKSTDTRSKTYNLKDIVCQTLFSGNILDLHKSLASPALYDVLSALLQLDKEVLYACEIKRCNWVF